MFTVIACSMFSQRKTECYPTVIPFHGISTYDLVCWGNQTEVSYGNTIPRNFVIWYVEENFWNRWIALLLRCGGSCVQSSEDVQVLEAEKKSAWTDLDRVDFEKISSKSQCSNRKIGVDRLRESQKRPLQRQVSFNFFRTGHPGVAGAFCTSMACPWQEV